ncbi:hypothetical protein O5291_24365 [Escherichia coli]|nr:hypothetical protein [Escherichia coli]
MWGAIAGAVGSVAGSLLGAHSAQQNAAQANKLTMDLTKNGMQYRVQDLRKAGLNPILVRYWFRWSWFRQFVRYSGRPACRFLRSG